MTLAEIFEKHGLTQRDVAARTGLALSAVNDVINGKRRPTTGTVNRLLDLVHEVEPTVTYEDIFYAPAEEIA